MYNPLPWFFREIRLSAFLFACVAILCQAGAAVYLLTGERIFSIPIEYAADRSVNDRNHIAWTIHHLRQSYDPGCLNVYVLGGSSERDAYENAEMEPLLEADLGVPVRYASLGSYGQSLLESFLIVGALPQGPQSVVVVQIGQSRVRGEGAMDPKLLNNYIQTPFIWQYAKPQIRALGFEKSFWELKFRNDLRFIRFYLTSRVRDTFRESYHLARNGQYLDSATLAMQPFRALPYERYCEEDSIYMISKPRYFHFVSGRASIFYAEKDKAEELLLRIAAHLRNFNSSLIIYFGPLSPLGRRFHEPIMPDLLIMTERIRNEYPGGVHLMLSDRIYEREEDFSDLNHLTSEGRMRSITPYTAELARILRETSAYRSIKEKQP